MAAQPHLDDDESSSTNDLPSSDSNQSLIALAMAKGAALMKEEHAALLERGVRDSCSSGQTPILAPIDTPSTLCPIASLASFEALDRMTDRYGSDLGDFLRQNDEFSIGPHESGRSSRLNPVVESAVVGEAGEDFQKVENASSKGQRICVYRRCLSGDVRPRSESGAPIPEDDTISISPVSVAEDVRPANPINEIEELVADETVVRSSLKGRSKSFDRRLNEALQFAEAVGEMPPLDQSYVQVIIEETGSDDDEDSDVEVHLHNQERISDATSSLSGLNGDSFPNVIQLDLVTPSTEKTNVTGPSMHKRQKSRPRWPLPSSTQPSISFLHKLPVGVSTQTYVYRGICSNPPEITKHGISRGNYAQLHRKAWLEVSDKYHRYGKNLRLYYKRWENLGYPTNQFFDWLDSKGEAAGQPLPNLEECPRSQLDADTVHYISNPEVTQGYAMTIRPDEQGRGKVYDVDNDPVITGSDGWIFVLRDHTLYGAEKIASISGHSKQRFHHSSFFGGKAVAAAGIIITDDEGILVRLYPHSGHYRPGEADMQRMLFHLHDSGVDLCTFEMDTQQILHVTRHDPPGHNNNDEGEKKKKKIQSLHLKKAVYVACFLAHKARFIGEGVFDQIHTIRKVDVTSVTEALEACDSGGIRAKKRRERKGETPP
jgi:hypothetical protein